MERYGLTPQELDEMYANQDGRCASCQEEISLLGRSTHIDHCHDTGKVRGILCRRCNSALGFLDDSAAKVALLLGYIESSISQDDPDAQPA